MTDPWADVRGLVETLDLSEATGANLAPIDYQIMMLLNDADALLAVVEAAEFAADPKHYNEVLYGVYKLDPGAIERLQKAITALPEHLK